MSVFPLIAGVMHRDKHPGNTHTTKQCVVYKYNDGLDFIQERLRLSRYELIKENW